MMTQTGRTRPYDITVELTVTLGGYAIGDEQTLGDIHEFAKNKLIEDIEKYKDKITVTNIREMPGGR